MASDSRMARLAKKYFDQHSAQFRSVWELYLTFYVAFLTLNGAALGLTVQYVTAPRAKAIIAITFILQNVLAAGTAVFVARYSTYVAERTQKLAELSIGVAERAELPKALQESPIPGDLGRWSGLANLIGHVLFAVLWSVVAFLRIQP